MKTYDYFWSAAKWWSCRDGGDEWWRRQRRGDMMIKELMLIMWMNNKRARTRGTIPPLPHLVTLCPTYSTALACCSVYSNVLIGHSGSLQSLDRDRLWCEATKAPTEYRIGQQEKFLFKESEQHRASNIFWCRSIRRAGPMSKRSFMQSIISPNTIHQKTGQTPVWCIVSLLHQNEGWLGKSIPNAREISSPSRNLLGFRKSLGDGFPKTSQVRTFCLINPSLKKGCII